MNLFSALLDDIGPNLAMFEIFSDDPFIKKFHEWLTAKCQGSKSLKTYIEFLETKNVYFTSFSYNFSGLEGQTDILDKIVPRPSNVFKIEIFLHFLEYLNCFYYYRYKISMLSLQFVVLAISRAKSTILTKKNYKKLLGNVSKNLSWFAQWIPFQSSFG